MTGVTDKTGELFADGFSFLESPRWHDGELYASDFFTNRVLRFAADGSHSVACTVPGQPAGLGWAADGSLLIASRLDRSLLRFDPGEGLLSVVADLRRLAPWHCNDLVVDDLGGAYIGNFGWDDSASPTIRTTDLIRVDPNGHARVAASGVVFPNGMALTPDGRRLLLAETFAGRISVFDRAGDGSLGPRRTWADFAPERHATIPALVGSGAPLPDGIALDAEGALWVADAAGSSALRVTEGGEILDRVHSGDDRAIFAVALGGEDGRSLYMCASVAYGQGDPSALRSSRMLVARVDVPAARWG